MFLSQKVNQMIFKGQWLTNGTHLINNSILFRFTTEAILYSHK